MLPEKVEKNNNVALHNKSPSLLELALSARVGRREEMFLTEENYKRGFETVGHAAFMRVYFAAVAVLEKTIKALECLDKHSQLTVQEMEKYFLALDEMKLLENLSRRDKQEWLAVPKSLWLKIRFAPEEAIEALPPRHESKTISSRGLYEYKMTAARLHGLDCKKL